MNNPPPNPPLQMGTTTPGLNSTKPARAITKTHVMLGVMAGAVGGFLLAVMLAIPVFLYARLQSQNASGQEATVISQAWEAQAAPTPQPPMEIPLASDAEARAMIAEIAAAALLSFENDIVGQLNQIASRPNLTSAAQVHLVMTIFKRLAFGHSQVQVLVKLISNPALAPEAKERILKDLNKMSFDHEKKSVLDALNKRESKK